MRDALTLMKFLDEFGPSPDLLELRGEMRHALEDLLAETRAEGATEALEWAHEIVVTVPDLPGRLGEPRPAIAAAIRAEIERRKKEKP